MASQHDLQLKPRRSCQKMQSKNKENNGDTEKSYHTKKTTHTKKKKPTTNKTLKSRLPSGIQKQEHSLREANSY